MAGPNAAGVAIVGATSPIGQFLISRFRGSNVGFYAIGRHARRMKDYDIRCFSSTLKRFDPPIREASVIINCAPLPIIWQVMDMAECLRAKRILAFGSTGRFSKSGSSSPIEQDFVTQQIEAEHCFESRCKQKGIAWTLFRPTMIYGAGNDLNVAFISNFIRRFGFFPVPRGAKGLRQPVHADDLAGACIAALNNARTFDRAYNLGGGERLLYVELVTRIFTAMEVRPCILSLPFPVCKLLVHIIRKIPKYRFINPDMVDRTFADLVADNSDAHNDFGYSPRKFFPTIADIYGPSAN